MKRVILSPAVRKDANKRRLGVIYQTGTIHSTSDPIKQDPNGRRIYDFPGVFVGTKDH